MSGDLLNTHDHLPEAAQDDALGWQVDASSNSGGGKQDQQGACTIALFHNPPLLTRHAGMVEANTCRGDLH